MIWDQLSCHLHAEAYEQYVLLSYFLGTHIVFPSRCWVHRRSLMLLANALVPGEQTWFLMDESGTSNLTC